MPLKPYDLIVIGTGSAALAAASRCRAAGWTVAVIDSRPYGGTCALRGCDPKKVLLAAAEALYWDHRLTGRGVHPGDARIDWGELMAFKRTFTKPVPKSNEEWLADLGIDGFHDRARFVGPTAVRVGNDDLEAKRVVIASGAVPATLAIPGEEHLINSDEFLGQTEPSGRGDTGRRYDGPVGKIIIPYRPQGCPRPGGASGTFSNWRDTAASRRRRGTSRGTPRRSASWST